MDYPLNNLIISSKRRNSDRRVGLRKSLFLGIIIKKAESLLGSYDHSTMEELSHSSFHSRPEEFFLSSWGYIQQDPNVSHHEGTNPFSPYISDFQNEKCEIPVDSPNYSMLHPFEPFFGRTPYSNPSEHNEQQIPQSNSWSFPSMQPPFGHVIVRRPPGFDPIVPSEFNEQQIPQCNSWSFPSMQPPFGHVIVRRTPYFDPIVPSQCNEEQIPEDASESFIESGYCFEEWENMKPVEDAEISDESDYEDVVDPSRRTSKRSSNFMEESGEAKRSKSNSFNF